MFYYNLVDTILPKKKAVITITEMVFLTIFSTTIKLAIPNSKNKMIENLRIYFVK